MMYAYALRRRVCQFRKKKFDRKQRIHKTNIFASTTFDKCYRLEGNNKAQLRRGIIIKESNK